MPRSTCVDELVLYRAAQESVRWRRRKLGRAVGQSLCHCCTVTAETIRVLLANVGAEHLVLAIKMRTAVGRSGLRLRTILPT